eukprot:TRINITY_DN2993_c0_g1_i2.p1 TRINITY_DN2993_c0_g1~~TRINITY_DN2993_c0_g1_i2.p1  ORF type:complete len:500 (-),score=95.70 TRINITY_DN2993_c0_g1_i2:14-1513(-)
MTTAELSSALLDFCQQHLSTCAQHQANVQSLMERLRRIAASDNQEEVKDVTVQIAQVLYSPAFSQWSPPKTARTSGGSSYSKLPFVPKLPKRTRPRVSKAGSQPLATSFSTGSLGQSTAGSISGSTSYSEGSIGAAAAVSSAGFFPESKEVPAVSIEATSSFAERGSTYLQRSDEEVRHAVPMTSFPTTASSEPIDCESKGSCDTSVEVIEQLVPESFTATSACAEPCDVESIAAEPVEVVSSISNFSAIVSPARPMDLNSDDGPTSNPSAANADEDFEDNKCSNVPSQELRYPSSKALGSLDWEERKMCLRSLLDFMINAPMAISSEVWINRTAEDLYRAIEKESHKNLVVVYIDVFTAMSRMCSRLPSNFKNVLLILMRLLNSENDKAACVALSHWLKSLPVRHQFIKVLRSTPMSYKWTVRGKEQVYSLFASEAFEFDVCDILAKFILWTEDCTRLRAKFVKLLKSKLGSNPLDEFIKRLKLEVRSDARRLYHLLK